MRLKIGTKILAVFFVMLVLISAVGYFGVSGINKAKTSYDDVINRVNIVVVHLWEVRGLSMEKVAAVRAFMLYKDEKYVKMVEDIDAQTNEAFATVEPLIKTGQSKVYLTDVKQQEAEYSKMVDDIFTLVRAGKMEQAMAKGEEAREVVTKFKANLDAWIKFASNVGTEKMATADADSSFSRKLTYGVIFGSMLLGIGLGLYLTRSISKPVTILTGIANEVAQGNLTKNVPEIKTGDEIQELGLAFGTMVTNLRNLIKSVNQSSQQVTNTSEGMSATAEQSSAATQQIAKAIGELVKDTLNRQN